MILNRIYTKLEFFFRFFNRLFFGFMVFFLIAFTFFIYFKEAAPLSGSVKAIEVKFYFLENMFIKYGNKKGVVQDSSILFNIYGKDIGYYFLKYWFSFVIGIFGCLIPSIFVSILNLNFDVKSEKLKGIDFFENVLDYLKVIKKLQRNKKTSLGQYPKWLPKGVKSRFNIGTIDYPIQLENKFIFGTGEQRMGKSVLIKQIIKGSKVSRKRIWYRGGLFTDEWKDVLIALLLGSVFCPLYVLTVSYFSLPLLFVSISPVFFAPTIYLYTRKHHVKAEGILDGGGVIFDVADLSEDLFRAKKTTKNKTTDVLIDPYDARSWRWNIFLDLTDDASVKSFCKGFFPDNPDKPDDIWPLTAQIILECVLKCVIALAKEQKRTATMQDLAYFLKTAGNISDLATFKTILQRYPNTFAQIKDLVSEIENTPSKTTQSAFITFSSKARDFLVSAWSSPLLKTQKEFSVKRFIDHLNSKKVKHKKWLFIRCPDQYKAAYTRMYTSMFNLMFSYIISFKGNKRSEWPRIPFIFDEFAALDRIESLPSLLFQGPKYGVFGIFFTQFPSQIYEKYGQLAYKSILSSFGTILTFKMSKSHDAQYITSDIGESWEKVDNVSLQMSEEHMNSSVSQMRTERKMPVTMNSDIQKLERFEFLISLGPELGWVKDKIPQQFNNRDKKKDPFKPFIDASYFDEIFNPEVKPEVSQNPQQLISVPISNQPPVAKKTKSYPKKANTPNKPAPNDKASTPVKTGHKKPQKKVEAEPDVIKEAVSVDTQLPLIPEEFFEDDTSPFEPPTSMPVEFSENQNKEEAPKKTTKEKTSQPPSSDDDGYFDLDEFSLW